MNACGDATPERAWPLQIEPLAPRSGADTAHRAHAAGAFGSCCACAPNQEYAARFPGAAPACDGAEPAMGRRGA
jgi:hypothetical protein